MLLLLLLLDRLVIHVPVLQIGVQRTELALIRVVEGLGDSVVGPGGVVVNGGVDLALRAVDHFIVGPVGGSGRGHLGTGNPAGAGAGQPTELRTFGDCPRSCGGLGSCACRGSGDGRGLVVDHLDVALHLSNARVQPGASLIAVSVHLTHVAGQTDHDVVKARPLLRICQPAVTDEVVDVGGSQVAGLQSPASL